MKNEFDVTPTEVQPTSHVRTAKYILAIAAWLALFGFAIFEMV